MASPQPLGLGIDAGGTATRWTLADRTGQILAQGSVDGLTALLMGTEAGRDRIADVLRQLLVDVGKACSSLRGGNPPLAAGAVQGVLAGFTGYSDDAPLRARLEALISTALALPGARVRVMGDIALAYLDSFAPGAGYLVYAGTGSIAAIIDTHGHMHRAGGRGSLLDDGGSGYWIAREAMRLIWRSEDEQPGHWRGSTMAEAVFGHIGGSEWARSREFFYQGTRGRVGELALAVAAAAGQGDAQAMELLRQAGVELARLALALTRRFGPRPVALAGGAVRLHPAIEASMRDALAGALGSTPQLKVVVLRAQETAARLAARDDPVLHQFKEGLPDVA
jgi:glucosamine kinase